MSNMPAFSLEGTGIEIRPRQSAFTEVIRTHTKTDHFKMADEHHLNGDTTLGGDGAVSEGCLPAECKFKVHTFFDTLLEQKVQFQILKMTDSLYVWIGTSSEMNALAVAMCTKYVSSLLETRFIVNHLLKVRKIECPVLVFPSIQGWG